MNDREKLKHLVSHWKEHNLEHARTYREWAERMRALNNTEIEEKLIEIGKKMDRMDADFVELVRMLL